LPFEQHENHHDHDEACGCQRADKRLDYASERFNRMTGCEYLDKERLFLGLLGRQRLGLLLRPVDFSADTLGKAVKPVEETIVGTGFLEGPDLLDDVVLI